MDRAPSKKAPAYSQEVRVPAMLRVRGDQIIGIEDHKGNVLGMPLTLSENSSGGIEVQDGSDTRGFVTAEIAAGVPTGNFS